MCNRLVGKEDALDRLSRFIAVGILHYVLCKVPGPHWPRLLPAGLAGSQEGKREVGPSGVSAGQGGGPKL